MSYIGVLRQRLVLQQESRNADTGGGAALSWEEVAIFWGSIEPLSGRESVAGEKQTGVLMHKIHARYDGGVTTTMRILHGDRVFNIRSVKNSGERNRLMEILAEEGSAT